mgnify:CR=1 FL=1
MKNKYPNASLLTIITQTIGNTENLLFIYLKSIPDYYPNSKVHWYFGIGTDIKPNIVWKKLKIKQWSACGQDKHIAELFDSIILDRRIKIDNTITEINFHKYNIVEKESNILDYRSDVQADFYITEHNPLIVSELFEKENIRYLTSDNYGSEEIKPLKPYAIISNEILFDYINQGIWGVKEYRTPYLTFHGVKEYSVKSEGSTKIIGLYQQN